MRGDLGSCPSSSAALDGRPLPSPRFLSELVRLLPQVKAYSRRLARRRADADDLVQDTLRRALEAHARFLPGTNLRGWLLCILRNHHRDCLRRAKQELSVGDRIDAVPAACPEEPTAPPWLAVSNEEAELALAALPTVFRQTYSLFALGGLSHAQIAAQLCIPVATVGTRVRRARFQMRRFLIARYDAVRIAQ